jgi:hypothetical protein
LGANGSVFFSFVNGSLSTATLLGFDEQTGATTLNYWEGWPADLLSAYGAGIALTSGGGVRYISYTGTTLNSYGPGNAVGAPGAEFIAFGAEGAVFFAGYSGCGKRVDLSVVKITPTGRAWTWTDPNASDTCELDSSSRTSISATPDGGAVVASYSGADAGSQPVKFTSIGPTGTFRWTLSPMGPLGSASYAEPPIVDNKGIVGLPTDQVITCADGTTKTCSALHIDFVSEKSATPTLSAFDWADMTHANQFGDFGDDDIAISTGRICVVRKADYVATLSAYSEPGLATSFTLSVQEAVAAANPNPGAALQYDVIGQGWCTKYHGTALGGYEGIYACQSTPGQKAGDDPPFGSGYGGIFQCTELANRFLYNATKGDYVNDADAPPVGLTGANFVYSVNYHYHLPTASSGPDSLPAAGDIISMWGGSSRQSDELTSDGHVAVVTAVTHTGTGWVITTLNEDDKSDSPGAPPAPGSKQQGDGFNYITVSPDGTAWSFNGGWFTQFKWLELSQPSFDSSPGAGRS